MSQADVIAGFIQAAAPRIAVVFIGHTPRQLGTLNAARSAIAVSGAVDAMLRERRLSATYISLAACRGKTFVAAHG